MDFDQPYQVFSGIDVRCLLNLSGEVKVIPADDAVFNQSVAGFDNLLFFLLSLGELARIADSHGTSEAVGEFDLGVRAILLTQVPHFFAQSGRFH